jgi:hypothetical protein
VKRGRGREGKRGKEKENRRRYRRRCTRARPRTTHIAPHTTPRAIARGGGGGGASWGRWPGVSSPPRLVSPLSRLPRLSSCFLRVSSPRPPHLSSRPLVPPTSPPPSSPPPSRIPSPSSFHPPSSPRAVAREAGGGRCVVTWRWQRWWWRRRWWCIASRPLIPSPLPRVAPPCPLCLSSTLPVIVPPTVHPTSSAREAGGGWCVVHGGGCGGGCGGASAVSLVVVVVSLPSPLESSSSSGTGSLAL